MRVLVRVLYDGKDLHLQIGTQTQLVENLPQDALVDVVFEEQDPPAQRGVPQKLRRRAAKEEAWLAGSIGGKQQKASGALPGAKGDVRKRGVLRIESKITTTKSYRVDIELLRKIRSECQGTEKPAFIIAFVDPIHGRDEERWVLQPYEVWHELQTKSAAVDTRPSDDTGDTD